MRIEGKSLIISETVGITFRLLGAKMQKITILFITIFLCTATAAAQTTAKELYETGKAASQKGDFKTAGNNYRKAFDLDPTALPSTLSAVAAKMNAKDAAGAYDALGAAIKADPDDSYLYFMRGVIVALPGVPAAAAGTAMADLDKVLETFPNNAGVYFFRAAMRLDKGDFDGAIADASKALDNRAQLEPQDIASAYFNRGKARYGKKDYDGTNLDLTKAIEIDPKIVDYYLVRAGARINKDDVAGVIADYSKVIELDPANAKTYITRGQLRFGTNDFINAIIDFTKAIEVDPKHQEIPVAYYNRGIAKLATDDPNGAVADCTKAIELKPNYDEAYEVRGAARGLMNDATGAIADLTKAIQLAPNNPGHYTARANQYRAMKKLTLAAADDKRAAKLKKP